jgi:hypothetical protein
MSSMIERISQESGCDKAIVLRIATLVLREPHRVAAIDDQVTTAAITETRWSFGAKACCQLGGLFKYHDDCLNQPEQMTQSFVPETLRRFLVADEELQQIKERWLSDLAKREPESE